MKLWFQEAGRPFWGGRYRYAAEQMLLTLFPGERPEYPAAFPEKLEEERAGVIFTLRRGEKRSELAAQVSWEGHFSRAAVRFSSGELEKTPEQVYHTLQRALKEAFYRAGRPLAGRELPWGSLTGVRPTKLATRALLSGKTRREAERELREIYHVSPARRRLAVECGEESVKALRSLKGDELSVYVGIPFCPTRCAYCSFISADVGRTLSLVEPYLEALGREIDAAGEALAQSGKHVRSIYIGGGTPTTLTAPQLERLLGRLAERLELGRVSEYTVEAGRPDTITAEKLAVLRRWGVERISVNPQSMSDGVLAAMGRAHTAADIYAAMDLVRPAGFRVVNMDLIAGLPTDTAEGFQDSLDRVLALGAENVTVHTLALKRGSRLMARPEQLPGGETVAAMLDYAWAALRQRGYRPYYLYRQKYMSGSFENVGWALPGTESLYNIAMMEELHTVLALGGGGMTKLVDTAGNITRLPNPKYPQEYIRSIETCRSEKQLLFTQAGNKKEAQHGLSAQRDQPPGPHRCEGLSGGE